MNDSSIYYEQNMNISTPIIGVLILFIARLQLSALRGQVDWLSHLHFHAALYVVGRLTLLLFAAAELGAL